MIFHDHHDDHGLFAKTAASPYLMNSPLVKEAAWEEKSELHDRDFALILVDQEGKEHRKYAMYDAGNTVMSTFYFLNNPPNIGEAGLKLAAYNLAEALMYQVPGCDDSVEYQTLRQVSAGVEKTAGVVDARRAVYSPVQEFEEPEPEEVSPFDLVKEASANWAAVPLFEKRAAAIEICSLADSYGISVPEKIAQYSGDALSPNFEMLMEHRTHRTANPELQDSYRRLSKLAHSMDPSEVIEAVFLIDEQANLLNKYGSALPDPVLCVYSTGMKKESSWSWNRGGDSVNERQLQSYASSVSSHSILEKLFGEDFRDAFKRNPVKVFERLPEEQQSIISRLATQSRFSNDGGN